jgi:hypothetical protein
MGKYMNPPERVKQVGRQFNDALVHYETLNRQWFRLGPDEELYAYVQGPSFPMTVRVSREAAFNEIWERYSTGYYTEIEFYAVKRSDEDP